MKNTKKSLSVIENTTDNRILKRGSIILPPYDTVLSDTELVRKTYHLFSPLPRDYTVPGLEVQIIGWL